MSEQSLEPCNQQDELQVTFEDEVQAVETETPGMATLQSQAQEEVFEEVYQDYCDQQQKPEPTLISRSPVKNQFTCSSCGKLCKDKYTLKYHMLRHFNQCKKCYDVFPEVELLKKHMLFAHKEGKGIKCNGCKEVFTNEREFKEHECNSEIKSGEAIHGKIIKNCVYNKCALCAQSFRTTDDFLSHLESPEHKLKEEKLNTSAKRKTPLSQVKSKFKSKSETMLRRTLQSRRDRPKNPRTIGGPRVKPKKLRYETPANTGTPIQTNESNEETTTIREEEIDWKVCEYCFRAFKTLAAATSHIKEVHFPSSDESEVEMSSEDDDEETDSKQQVINKDFMSPTNHTVENEENEEEPTQTTIEQPKMLELEISKTGIERSKVKKSNINGLKKSKSEWSESRRRSDIFCKICNMTFTRQDSLVRHKRRPVHLKAINKQKLRGEAVAAVPMPSIQTNMVTKNGID